MKRYCFSLLIAAMLSTLIIGCSHGDKELAPVPTFDDLAVTHSMKGWELYSWPEGNNWKFAFLVGTNRLKSLSEVKSSNGTEVLIRVTGVDAARMVLNKFPQGESITLLGQGWLQIIWQGQHGNLQLPPQSIISQLNTLASQKNLTFTIAN